MATDPIQQIKPPQPMRQSFLSHFVSSRRGRFPAAAVRAGSLVGAGLLLVAGSVVLSPAQAADRSAGEKIAGERCAACHGKDGSTPIDPSYPKLAGQHADYLVVALKQYRSERRKNAIMGAQAKPLTNADIDNLAAYYAALPSQLSVRK